MPNGYMNSIDSNTKIMDRNTEIIDLNFPTLHSDILEGGNVVKERR